MKELLAGRGRLIDSFSGDGFTPLALACFFGHEEAATWLVNQGASVTLAADNKMGVAPIHAATGGRHTSLLRMLVENGADVNARQQQGFTALHAAAQNGDSEAVRLLLDHGADRELRADSNQTPLDLALQRGLGEIVELLES
jgi:ankyrin repeat protein